MMEVIRPIPEDLLERESGRENLNFLLKYSKVYVMDNHLAAGWCWLQEVKVGDTCCFFHVDQHQDLLDDSPIERYNTISDNPHLSLDEYTALEFDNGYGMSKVIRWDTYIKQMQHLSPSWFSECLFACPDPVQDPARSTDIPLNIIYNPGPLELYDNVHYWINRHSEPFIFNLDLDYFFNDRGMQLFSDDYIHAFASDVNMAMDRIAVMTIALSPECCGSWDNAIRVFNLIADRIDLIDENPFRHA